MLLKYFTYNILFIVGRLSYLYVCFHAQHILLITKCQRIIYDKAAFNIKRLSLNIFESTLSC